MSAVRGSRQVSGRGRVELYGRARVGDPHRALGDLRNRIDQHIESFLPRHVAPVAGSRSVVVSDLPWHQQSGDYEETIARPAWDMLEGGGKRWRPLFGLLLMEALQVPSAPYEQLLAVAAELPHTGALIIDDIQDRSASRRGKPTTHVRHGVDTAINVGNALYFAPFDLLARTPLLSDAQRLDAFQAMTAELLRAHLGQGTDIRLGRLAAGTTLPVALGNGLERDVLCSYRQKTGAVMASVAELVAIVAGVSPEMRRQTVDFAESLGVAFQIVDDVLNLSEDARLGKTDGEDLVDGKLTYVVLRALKALSAADAAMLWDTIARAAAGQKDVDIVPGLAAIRASGVLAECQREAMTIFEESWSAWRSHVEPSDARLLLGVLCRKMLRRGRPPVAPA